MTFRRDASLTGAAVAALTVDRERARVAELETACRAAINLLSDPNSDAFDAERVALHLRAVLGGAA